MGGRPASGLGRKMSMTQTSTQTLQPLQTSSLNSTGLLGVITLGNARTWSEPISLLQPAMGFVARLQVAVVVQGQLARLDAPVVQPDGHPLAPLRRVDLRVVGAREAEEGVAGLTRPAGLQDHPAVGDDVETLQQPRELVRVPGVGGRRLARFQLVEPLEADLQQLLALQLAAVVLPDPAGAGVELLPLGGAPP